MPDFALGHTRLIQDTCRAEGLSVAQTAYVLATAYWETARTMLPVEEAYYLGVRAAGYRQRLRYYPWYGRGFVQLTWQDNYERAGRELGLDLTTDPSAVMDPRTSAQIIVIGSRDGWFTGKKLSDFIDRDHVDYINARRVINGLDAARAIADLALEYEHQLTPAPAYPALRRGSRGAPVTEAQRLLAAQGYDPGAIDGIFGGLTEGAARNYQRSAGLKADGIIGPLTWAALLGDDT